jgi:hypothetical protein
MKTWKLLPQNNFFKALLKKGARGQSIVEFVLLLLVITGLSFSFVAVMNGNLARYWEYSANLVINDKPGGPKAVSLR